MNKVSIVIRNKNEASYLETTLGILTGIYSGDIQEIILIDNESIDNSVEVAENYGCKIFTITDFTYGRAINMGIEKATSDYVLLLSSHAVPIGKSFFFRSLQVFDSDPEIGGIRYVNSVENYKRAIENNFEVKIPFRYGLMAACCLINKKVWENHKFDESLVAIEDKEWSKRVDRNGFKIVDLDETYFYFLKRSKTSSLNRFKIETIAEYQLQNKAFSSPIKSIISFFKKILWTNNINYLRGILQDIRMLRVKIDIYENLKKKSAKK